MLLVPDIRLEIISVNFIVELLESARFHIVIIEIDSVFKRAHFISTHTTVTVKGDVRLFLYNTWKLHSLLIHMISKLTTVHSVLYKEALLSTWS